ncbi:MAG: cupin domain-containing protein [bacterium]
MNVRADLSQTVFVSSKEFTWQPSPLSGVERVLLDRVGDEVAVATSLVRYAPGASFDPHQHALGEEFIVLDGVFSDEHADYPAGSYIRNPPGTGHTPHSDPGCVIFVKLRQFADKDLTPVVTQLPMQTSVSASSQHLLYQYNDETVSYVEVPAGERFAFAASYYVRELLIISGELDWQQEQTHRLGAWSWIRMAPGQPLRINAVTPCVLFSKTRPVYRKIDV